MKHQETPEDSASPQAQNLRCLVSTPDGDLLISALSRQAAEANIIFSLVIPTYNETENIRSLVTRLTSVLDPKFGDKYELIVVDDDSPDRTWEVALQLSSSFPKLRTIRRVNERGLSTAVIRGWQAARGQYLGVIDADLQHPPEIIVKLIDKVQEEADLAIGSRNIEGGGVSDWSIARRFVSRVAQVIGLVVLPGIVGRVSDPMSGYFVLNRDSIAGTRLNPLGYKILIEVIARGNFKRISEVPYVFQERAEGKSKATLKVYVEYLLHLARIRAATLPIARFARFATVGLSGVLVDMMLLYLLSDPSQLSWGLTRSKLIAAEAAIINNFFWNDVWTFRDLSEQQKGLTQRLKRFLKFHVICSVGLVMNVTLLNIQFNWLGINRYIANAVAIGTVTAWNFWLNLKLSWRVTDTCSSTNQTQVARKPLQALSTGK